MPTDAVNTNGQRHLCGNSKVRRISEWVDSVDHSYEPSEQGTWISSPTHSSYGGNVDFFGSVGDFLFPSAKEQNKTLSRPVKQLNKRSADNGKCNNNVKTNSKYPSPLSQKGSLSASNNACTGKHAKETKTNSNTEGHANLHTPFSPLSNQPTRLGVNSDKSDTGLKLPSAAPYQTQSTENMQLDSQLSFHGLENNHLDSQERTQLPDCSETAMEIDNYEQLEDQIKLEVRLISTCMVVRRPGFVLLLQVLEKPWNLILDFKGT